MMQTVLWQNGADGFHTYRIPAIVATPRGTVLAFCEGRKASQADWGDIALLAKRSTDGGATWSEQAVVWDGEGLTCGNPCPVVDETTGTIWLLATSNRADDREHQIIDGTSADTRRVHLISSPDDGITWSSPREITRDVKQADWTWYATGPGNGIQIQDGPHRGRLLAACDHIESGTKRYYSHTIYSDDHGATWRLGGSSRAACNECTVAELSDGRLMLNMRNADPAKTHRQKAFSRDGGITWCDQVIDEALIEPICQAGILRYDSGTLLFSNPASRERAKLTVRASFDNGASWPQLRVLHEGPSAYSCLAVLADGAAACLYECGDENPYERIMLARFTLGDLYPPGA